MLPAYPIANTHTIHFYIPLLPALFVNQLGLSCVVSVMKSLLFLAISLAASAGARSLHNPNQQAIALEEQQSIGEDKYLIELSPGETKWVAEEEKWELKRVRLQWDCNEKTDC